MPAQHGMNADEPPGVEPFAVPVADGGEVVVWVQGHGPPLVMVHGSIADHTTFEPLVAELARDMTTYAMDRRGFGASADAPDYALEREFRDVAAVVDAVAERTGGPVGLWGHSYGANCALGGAALTDKVHHLVLYEPSLGLRYPSRSIERVEQALQRGDREGAIVAVLVDALELSPGEVDALRASPLWPTRLAAAHTIPRECRVEESFRFGPGCFDGVSAPTLLVSGADSPAAVKECTRRAAAALPGAHLRILHGHAHFAHKTDPVMVSRLVHAFMQT